MGNLTPGPSPNAKGAFGEGRKQREGENRETDRILLLRFNLLHQKQLKGDPSWVDW